jgi:hypothetical protein
MTFGHILASAAMTFDAAAITAAEINMLIIILRVIPASSAITEKLEKRRQCLVETGTISQHHYATW